MGGLIATLIVIILAGLGGFSFGYLGSHPVKQLETPPPPLFPIANKVYLALTEHYRTVEVGGKKLIVATIDAEMLTELGNALGGGR